MLDVLDLAHILCRLPLLLYADIYNSQIMSRNRPPPQPTIYIKKHLLIKFPENCKTLVEENEKDILSGNISKVCVRINTMKMSVLFKGVHEQYLLTSVTLFIYFI